MPAYGPRKQMEELLLAADTARGGQEVPMHMATGLGKSFP